MKYSIQIPGFEEQNLQIEVRFPFRPRIWSNKKLQKSNTGKWNELAMRRDDGLTSIVMIKSQFPDPVPQLEMDGEMYKAVEPFKLGERVLALMPVLLIAIGLMDLALALYGLGLGLIAIYINFWVLRIQEQKLERNLMIFTITIAATVILFIIRFMLIRSQIGL